MVSQPELPTQPAEGTGEQTASTANVHLGALSFAYARRHGVLVKDMHDDHAEVLYRADVTPLSVLNELRRYLDRPVRFEPAEPASFDALLEEYYQRSSHQTIQMAEDLGEDMDLHRVAEQLPEPTDLLESEDDAPIIRLINALLTQAVKEDASDIHVEPYEDHLAVRYRVDGVLREVLRPPRVIAPLLTSRIKVMARLDIAEKRLPQDGRIALRVAGRPVDVRVSTLPSSHGERVVLRLLDKQTGRLDLEHLGMAPETLKTVERMIHKPHGIILVTGPTGSGKTTSLYAAIHRLNDRQRNIMTVEDPIEYELEGVGQTQVNTKVDLSFARGLRAILRQDPDIVMVGEIRDLETAEIAVQASLTGHLVFSTLHTNTAVGAVTRLRDMGVEPFLISSSLLGVVAQRLVRVLCPACKSPYTATESDRQALGVADNGAVTLYAPAGCEHCNQLGYRGRTGIFEVVALTDPMRQMIHDGAGEYELETHARAHSPSIRADGWRLVREGITSVEEVLRVSHDDQANTDGP